MAFLVIVGQASGRAAKHSLTPFSTIPAGLSVFVPMPLNNPITDEKIELGRQLFFEKELSRNRVLNCASCHDPRQAYADSQQTSIGITGHAGRRNTPSLINAAFHRRLFWDGRAVSLEDQALIPITSPDELGNDLETVVRRLAASAVYPQLFQSAFGTNTITSSRIAEALATFQRTLVSGDSRFDRFRMTGNSNLLSSAELEGFHLFRTKARCAHCHEGPLLTDREFHNTGVGWQEFGNLDLGRFEQTGHESHRGQFLTPSLRNVSLTAPYMHNGNMQTLREVIDFYDRGGGTNRYQDRTIRPLGLSAEEKRYLEAFLGALTGKLPVVAADQ